MLRGESLAIETCSALTTPVALVPGFVAPRLPADFTSAHGGEATVATACAFRAHETLQDNNVTLNGTKAVSNIDVGLRELMTVCLSENDRRFAGYDLRLLRPSAMPRLVRFALRFLKRRC
jgi:hypothetical protein